MTTRGILFDDEGNPYPVNTTPVTKARTQAFLTTLLALAYKGDDSEKEEYKDATNVEVILRRIVDRAAGGDYEAAKFCMEYMIGKPKQQVDVTHNIESYHDFAARCIKEDQTEITVAALPIFDDEEDDLGI